MATIHFIQQGKGGVGKSMIAVILFQVLRHLGREVMAFDTDPVNSTLAGFKEFEVTRLDILKDGDIDPREFDGLINAIAALPPETHVIVDNGASSFLALNSYIKENDVLGILTDSGHSAYFHSVITGGQAVADTALGLRSLALGFPDSPIVVWLNPYFGEIRMDDRPFEEFKADSFTPSSPSPKATRPLWARIWKCCLPSARALPRASTPASPSSCARAWPGTGTSLCPWWNWLPSHRGSHV